ncbi:putative senescence regulator S40 [Helianthus debilis subsp. tardiflorus]
MMAEEFDESEVTFVEFEAQNTQENHTEWQHYKLKTKSKKKTKKHSTPISIPKGISCVGYVESDLFEDDYEYERIVPPHVILARRVARKVAYSICAGCGKTSKGRELIQVRDLIFRLLGYLES